MIPKPFNKNYFFFAILICVAALAPAAFAGCHGLTVPGKPCLQTPNPQNLPPTTTLVRKITALPNFPLEP